MANVKITDLTALTTAATNDLLEIVDVSAGGNKKITVANLLNTADSVTSTSIVDKAVIGQKLGQPIAFAAYLGASQNITNSTKTTMQFNTEYYDYGDNYDHTTYTFTAPYDGVYQFSAGGRIPGVDADEWASCYITTSNSAMPSFRYLDRAYSANTNVYPRLTVEVYLDAGDTVKAEIEQISGGTQSLASGFDDFTYFMGRLVGRI